MLEFKPITPDDFSVMKPYFENAGLSSGIVFMWRHHYNTSYTIINDTLITKNEYMGNTSFSIPVGNDVTGALELICKYADDNGIDPVISFVTKDSLALLSELYECYAVSERDLADYIYLAEDLAYMRGRKYSGQRGHINYFTKNYPDFEFRNIDSTNIDEVKAFYADYLKARGKTDESFLAEADILPEIFDNPQLYGFDGLTLYAHGKVVAFAMGESVNDTLWEHIEKADPGVRGAYQMIASGFARCYADKVKYVNREDDAGDEGLRKSKLSYQPVKLEEKFSVTLIKRKISVSPAKSAD
ncbi:MAG: DUF2156 domain-containing protein [Clostridia bacterium]|nr:DUF2156 domain-containing protein [Clostridia bacterium]